MICVEEEPTVEDEREPVDDIEDEREGREIDEEELWADWQVAMRMTENQ